MIATETDINEKIEGLLIENKYRKKNRNLKRLVKKTIESYLVKKYSLKFKNDFLRYLKIETGFEKDIFSESENIKEVLESILGDKVAKIIIKGIIIELNLILKKDIQNIQEIFMEIQKEETIKILQNKKIIGNITVLFSDQEKQKEILEEFFDPEFSGKSIMGLFAHKIKKSPSVKTILYQELSKRGVLDQKKMISFFETVFEQNKSDFAKFACSDSTWLIENNFHKSCAKVGEKIDKKIINNSIILCCYDLNRMDLDMIKQIIQTDTTIILDNSYSIFEKQDNVQ